MANVLRIGIVGCGRIARGSHAPGFAAVPGTRITALCDLDKSRTAAIRDAQAPDALCFDNYNRMLEQAPMDAVSIGTTNRLHAPMTQAALKKGLHVLCEKPMAGTLPDATGMIAAARKAGRILQINQSLRYHALYQTAVKGRLPCPTPGELGREALAICDAIVKSGTQHRFVNVKSFKNDASNLKHGS